MYETEFTISEFRFLFSRTPFLYVHRVFFRFSKKFEGIDLNFSECDGIAFHPLLCRVP